MNQYKKKNPNIFKINQNNGNNYKANYRNLTDTSYNILDDNCNSTKTFFFEKEEKVTNSIALSKNNIQKAINDVGEFRLKKNIKFGFLEYKKNLDNKCILIFNRKNYLLKLI